jgi:hypothetical protein
MGWYCWNNSTSLTLFLKLWSPQCTIDIKWKCQVCLIEIVRQVSTAVSPFPVIYISLDESIGHGSKEFNILDPRDMKCIKWNTQLTAIFNVKLGNVEFHSGPTLKPSRLFTNKITWSSEPTVMIDWTKQGNRVHSTTALPLNLGLQIRA